MTDELLYQRLSLSFVDGAFLPTLHGEHVDVYAVLYPFLLMPVYAIVDMPDAVRTVHGLNGVLFASAVLPTWFLARELVLPRFASIASAVFAVALPWMVIGGFVMTEAAAYPASLLAVLKAADYWVTRYELTTERRGFVQGATYAVVNAQLPAVVLLSLISVGFIGSAPEPLANTVLPPRRTTRIAVLGSRFLTHWSNTAP